MARTICRRAERCIVELKLMEGEAVSDVVCQYVNRLSDHLFVASRYVNGKGKNDLLWRPGLTR
jgi:cob(I)alamin adenosyltransferase